MEICDYCQAPLSPGQPHDLQSCAEYMYTLIEKIKKDVDQGLKTPSITGQHWFETLKHIKIILDGSIQ